MVNTHDTSYKLSLAALIVGIILIIYSYNNSDRFIIVFCGLAMVGVRGVIAHGPNTTNKFSIF